MEQLITITLESDIKNSSEIEKELTSYCKLYSHLERILFNHLKNKKNINSLSKDLQREYVKKYNIHARIFKTLFKQVTGKIQSIKSNNKNRLSQTKSKIKHIENKIEYFEKSKKDNKGFIVYNNKLNKLKQKLENLKKNSKIQSIWGSKFFYNKQWNHKNKQEWIEQWRIKRDNNLIIIGSHDESFGNSLCQLQNLKKLRLTLPHSFNKKYLILEVDFHKKKKIYNYLLKAIANNQALTWRIFQNSKNKKWYAQVSFIISNECEENGNGVVGLDLNYNLIALCNIKKDGNKQEFKNITFDLDKNNTYKNTQILSDIVHEVIDYCKTNNKSLVIEKLDLKNKVKDDKITWVVYHKFFTLLKSYAVKQGVLIIKVNPAYTSIIGGIKYKKRFGVSRHASAAYVIGRRGINLVEKVPAQIGFLLHSGEKRNHSWSKWNLINKRLKKVSLQEKSIFLDYFKNVRPTELNLNPGVLRLC